ncbi:MAG: PqqD family protein [Bacteroidales bacterium]|nr:PqqD family protein [Bacteroidales bacterium]
MKIYVTKKKNKIEKIDNEYYLDPSTNELDIIISLNITALFIWEKTDRKTSAENIAQQMSQQFNVNEKTTLADVIEFYDEIENIVDLVEL